MPNHLFALDSNRHPPQGASTAASGAVLKALGADVVSWVPLGGDVSGPPDNVAVTDLTIASQATGSILYFNGSNWIRLAIGSATQVLTVSGGVPVWAAGGAGSGDVVGPGASIDNAIPRFDGTTGKLIQDYPATAANNAVTVSDTGVIGKVDKAGTDIAGQALTIAGGAGTGTGAPGVIVFQTAIATVSGTTVQTLATAMTLEARATNGQALSFPNGSVAVGGNNGVLGATSAFFGYSAASTQTDVVCVGYGATASGSFGIAIGRATAAGSNSLAIGRGSTVSNSTSIGIGRTATSTASNQLVVGTIGVAYANWFAPEGVTTTTASKTDWTIRGSGGSGTDQTGTNVRLAAGSGTGTGLPGLVFLASANATTTGTTLQTQVDRVVLGGSSTTMGMILGNPDLAGTGIVAAPVAAVTLAATSSNSAAAGSSLTIQAGHNFSTGNGAQLYLKAGSGGGNGADLILESGNGGSGGGGTWRARTGQVASPVDRVTIEPNGAFCFEPQGATSHPNTRIERFRYTANTNGTAQDVLTYSVASGGVTWVNVIAVWAGATVTSSAIMELTGACFNNAGTTDEIGGATFSATGTRAGNCTTDACEIRLTADNATDEIKLQLFKNNANNYTVDVYVTVHRTV